jgi:hypothetical protein
MALSGLGAGLLLAACGGTPASLAQQVRSWAASTGFAAGTRELTGDLSRLSDLPSDSPGARRTACDVLVTDALSANQQLPTPDSQLTNLLSQAYTSAATAGRDCFSGGTLLARTGPEAQKASSALIRAEARYDLLTSALAPAS